MNTLTEQCKIIESQSANIAGILKEIAERSPERLALIEGSGKRTRSISYGALSNQVARKATELRQSGLRKNDIVLMLQPMSIDLYVSILAIFRIGATVLFADASSGLDTIDRAVKFVKPNAVIAAGKGVMAALALRNVGAIPLRLIEGFKIPGWRSIGRELPFKSKYDFSCKQSARLAAITPVRAAQPALITFTSGTSGNPKAIVRTHEFLRAQLSALQNNVGLDKAVCELTGLPIFVLANLASGITTVIPDADLSKMSKLKVGRLVDQIIACKPQRILGSPALIEAIVAEGRKRGRQFGCVKSILTGGGPVFPRMLKDARRVFPEAELQIVYGSSEAEPIAKINFAQLSEDDLDAIKDGAGLPVGMPINEIQIRILPVMERDGELEDADQLATMRHICERSGLTLDRIGEIIVTGDHVVKAYLRGAGDAETKIEIDGRIWHRTGDAGYIDDKGRVWLTGRVNSPNKPIEAAGAQPNVDMLFSQCVEAAVLSHDIIRRAACLRFNHKTTIYVETRTGEERLDTSTIKDGLGWSQMHDIKVVRHIPLDKRHNTKVLYNKLVLYS